MAADRLSLNPDHSTQAHFQEEFSRPDIEIKNVIPNPTNLNELAIMQHTGTGSGERRLMVSLGGEEEINIVVFNEFSFTRRLQWGGGEEPERYVVGGEKPVPKDILEAAMLGTGFAQFFGNSSEVTPEAALKYKKMHQILAQQQ